MNEQSKDMKKGRPDIIPEKEKQCKQCHKTFMHKYNDRMGLFCSQKCYLDFSKENATNYRIKAFSLLPNECFYCAEENKKKLLVHHKDRNFLNNDIDNLQIICRRCHAKEHKNECLDGRFKQFKDGQILRGLRMVLSGLRLNLDDPNFKETPQRILRSYYEMFDGLNSEDEVDTILSTSFPTDYDGMIIESPIRCYSMCPHHFLPVVYDVSIGYVPKKGGLGLSKLPRIVELLAKAPKLQEDFTKQIVNKLEQSISPLGVMVVVKGEHFCMQMRGIKKPGCTTTTSSFMGVFEKPEVREEFIQLTEHNN
jgi:GTP cyclohydrolase I